MLLVRNQSILGFLRCCCTLLSGVSIAERIVNPQTVRYCMLWVPPRGEGRGTDRIVNPRTVWYCMLWVPPRGEGKGRGFFPILCTQRNLQFAHVCVCVYYLVYYSGYEFITHVAVYVPMLAHQPAGIGQSHTGGTSVRCNTGFFLFFFKLVPWRKVRLYRAKQGMLGYCCRVAL